MSSAPMSAASCPGLTAFALPGIPMVSQGDDLVGLIVEAAHRAGSALEAGDIIVIERGVSI